MDGNMKHFLGPFAFLWDLPEYVIPARFAMTLMIVRLVWRAALVVGVIVVGLVGLYRDFLWER